MAAQTALAWIRRDLRLSDHAVLSEATALADQTAVLFVFDTNILSSLEPDDRRVTFIRKSLIEVDEGLRRHGSRLIVRIGDPLQIVPEVAQQLGVDTVYAGRDFEPYAIERDADVGCLLSRHGIRFEQPLDHVIQGADELFNQTGEPFRVFTPYSKAWLARYQPEMAAERVVDLEKLMPADRLEGVGQPWDWQGIGFEENDLWVQPGESGARRQFREFLPAIESYAALRDFPAREATSGLSVHLRFGTLSIRECVREAVARLPHSQKWLSELIWREFYSMILGQFPHVVESTFQPAYRDLEWPGDPAHFEAWKEGRTGYPIVDAAMRCLNATGWMHNRLRMVVASFLTKDLLLDWRLGEAYFAQKLLDFELASNNGGWQWAASTGVDAQPYFRIFNPILQSKKFDPDGVFIRRWCPELASLKNEWIHFPSEAPMFDQMDAGCEIGVHYPAPIVRHAEQKERAVALLSRG